MDIKIYDKLAKKYDLATKVVSFYIEEIWRKIFVRKIKKYIKNGTLLDVASATGEMARALNFDKMYLIEPSKQMNLIASEKLKVKNEKCDELRMENGEWRIKCKEKEIIIIENTAENFKIDEKVDLITAFMAIRNFDNLEKGMKNLNKHLKNGGYFAIVEMVKSDVFFAKIIMFYMNKIVPIIAGIITGMKEEYKLLGKSIVKLDEKDILDNLKGYDIIEKKRLLFIATLIIARKNEG